MLFEVKIQQDRCSDAFKSETEKANRSSVISGKETTKNVQPNMFRDFQVKTNALLMF